MKNARGFVGWGCGFLFIFQAFTVQATGVWDRIRKENELSVVSLYCDSMAPFGDESSGRKFGAGFVVDAAKGWIATNQIVTRTGKLSAARVKFSNAFTIDAKLKYYDATHNFSIMEIDPAKVPFRLRQVKLGSISELRDGSEVMSISYDWNEDVTSHMGTIRRLFKLSSPNFLGRHSHHLDTGGDFKDESYGSPIISKNGNIVAIHSWGDTGKNLSRELRIEYVADALRSLRAGKIPPRGDLQVALTSESRDAAIDYFNLSKEEADRHPDTSEYLRVDRILPGSDAERQLTVRDLIISVQGKSDATPVFIGRDSYLFDKKVDENVTGSIKLFVNRDGEFKEVVLPVADAEAEKIRAYAEIGGATLHNVTAAIGLKYAYAPAGVYISSRSPVSMFSRLGIRPVIFGVNGNEVRNLDEFISLARTLKVGSSIHLFSCDLTSGDFNPTCKFADVNTDREPLRVFTRTSPESSWQESR
jgi:S1-C subfamily serine protease